MRCLLCVGWCCLMFVFCLVHSVLLRVSRVCSLLCAVVGRCLLLVDCWFVARCSLLGVRCLLSVICVVFCVFGVVGCLKCVGRCRLVYVCCLLSVVDCLLLDARCWLLLGG